MVPHPQIVWFHTPKSCVSLYSLTPGRSITVTCDDGDLLLRLLIVEVNDLVRRLFDFCCHSRTDVVQISREGAWGEVGEDLDAKAWERHSD